MKKKRMGLLVLLAGLLIAAGLFTACGGDDDDGGGSSGLGESCTKTDDCKSGLKCVDLKCVAEQPDGDIFDGDTTTDGDDSGTDGDGESLELDLDADTDPFTDTDVDMDPDPELDPKPDVEIEIEPDPEPVCTSHTSFACDSGDVYWYDSCGVRESKKQDCSNCSCSGNACVDNNTYTFACNGGDVYYKDCFGNWESKKEECDNCACSGNACTVNNQYSSQCYDDDVYWYDCHGVRAAKKAECGANGCTGGACGTVPLSCTGGICTDNTTGFEWQQETTGGTMTWSSAKTHCQRLSLDGSGWRLPNISELRSLIRNCASIETGGLCGVMDECSPCGVSSGDACLLTSCNELNNCNPSSCSDDGGPTGCYWPEELSETCSRYWSSSPVEDNDDSVWYVNFVSGVVYKYYGYVGYYAYVRCVR